MGNGSIQHLSFTAPEPWSKETEGIDVCEPRVIVFAVVDPPEDFM